MGSTRRALRPLRSHSSTVLSWLAVARVCPSGANATDVAQLVADVAARQQPNLAGALRLAQEHAGVHDQQLSR